MKLLAVIVVSVAIATTALSCDCGWSGPFVEMASSESAVVVIARVKEYRYVRVPKPAPGQREDSLPPPHSPDAMVLEIEHVLKGGTLGPELLVFGDDGFQCRPYVTSFPVGTEWAFVLHRSHEESYVSVCGEFWLEKSGGKFHGAIEGKNPKGRHSVSLEELTKKIEANQSPEPTRSARGSS